MRQIWQNGILKPWAQATLHVTSEAVLRGATVFEGVRCYADDDGQLRLFRLEDHLRRLRQSAKIMRLPIAYNDNELRQATMDLVRADRMDGGCHIRMTAYFDEGAAYSWREEEISTGLFIFAIDARTAAPPKAPIRSCTSTWRRNADEASPSRVKTSANYHNSRLAMVEARVRGYDVPLMLNSQGELAESPSSCVFLIRDGVLITPPIYADILESITRDTILTLAREDLGLSVLERPIDRTEAYICDEAFLCGTAHEILPIGSIDDYPIGSGRVGPITSIVRGAYDCAVRGRKPGREAWNLVLPPT